MANEGNLINIADRPTSEQREIQSAGGKARGAQRRKNRTIDDIAARVRNLSIADTKNGELLREMGLKKNELTMETLAVVATYKEAAKGNPRSQALAMQYSDRIEARAQKAELERQAQENRTYHMDLDDISDVFHAPIRQIRHETAQEFVFKGGRGSTKSSTVAMIILELIKNNPDVHALVCRKVGNTIKDSVYSKMKWAIHKQGLDDEFVCIKSPYEITRKSTGQKIYFRGADDEGKLKSLTPEFGYIGILWLEELDQFDGAAQMRNIRQSAIRGGRLGFTFLSFNPPKTKNNWANIYALEQREGKVVHHSDYRDVPAEWLEHTFLEDAEHLKEVNPEAYEHEYLGIPNGSGGMVFDYLELRTITDEEVDQFDHIYEGVDWGFYPDPYAFVRVHYDHARETVYLLDEHVCHKTSNADTAAWILSHQAKDDEGKEIKDSTPYVDDAMYGVICDSAEPKSIKDYQDAGIYNAKPVKKGPGSVDYRMKWLAGKKIVIDQARTPVAYEEFTNYEYDRDKDGNVISGYPDRDNHTIDAVCYAMYPVWARRGSSA